MLNGIDYVFSSVSTRHFFHRSSVSSGFNRENFIGYMQFMTEDLYLEMLFEGIKRRDSVEYYLFLRLVLRHRS
jgi:hypothetical protein